MAPCADSFDGRRKSLLGGRLPSMPIACVDAWNDDGWWCSINQESDRIAFFTSPLNYFKLKPSAVANAKQRLTIVKSWPHSTDEADCLDDGESSHLCWSFANCLSARALHEDCCSLGSPLDTFLSSLSSLDPNRAGPQLDIIVPPPSWKLQYCWHLYLINDHLWIIFPLLSSDLDQSPLS